MIRRHLAAALLSLAATPAVAAPAGPLGTWLTATGNVEVEIAPCGAALCGTVVRVLANRSMSSSAESAAAPARRGLKILTGLTPDGSKWSGSIYNRENGRTYDCNLSLASADRLTLRAYVGIPLFGKTQTWTRVARPARPAPAP